MKKLIEACGREVIVIGAMWAALFGGLAVASAYTEHHNPLSIVERLEAPYPNNGERMYEIDKAYDEANGTTCYVVYTDRENVGISCVK